MEKIGKYPVLRRLGEGATASVWLCQDPFAGREVAVKLLSQDAFAKAGCGRLTRKLFVTEASLAGKLTHPHIVQIYDASADADPAYIVMEYVPGGTLEAFGHPDNLMHVVETVEIAFKCTRALAYAASMGVIHRDLKPANILRAEGTNVKISDFGAALMASAETTQVSNIGSPAYMSPQQLKEHPLNHQTDIFSLGVVMYQLLTGSLPFSGSNNFAIIYQITHLDPPPPSTLRPAIPSSLDAIVMKALQKPLEARYQSWDEFSFDLAEAFRCAYRQPQRIADTEKFDSLRGLSFFREFGDVQLWEVVRFSQWRRASAGEALMREGEPGDHFCILAEGDVKITSQGKLLNVLGPGECFGEMAYLNRERAVRGADVTTMSDATVMTVSTRALDNASESCRASFDRAFLRILVERLSLANRRLTAL